MWFFASLDFTLTASKEKGQVSDVFTRKQFNNQYLLSHHHQTVAWLRRFVADVSPGRSGFNHRPVHVAKSDTSIGAPYSLFRLLRNWQRRYVTHLKVDHNEWRNTWWATPWITTWLLCQSHHMTQRCSRLGQEGARDGKISILNENIWFYVLNKF